MDRHGIPIRVCLLCFFVALVSGCGLYPSRYVYRVLGWRNADVDDYSRFPARTIERNESIFAFHHEVDEARVRRAAPVDSRHANLEKFLEKTGTQAFIVIKDDTVLYERYFNGAARESIVTSFSVAKSFVSAMVGVAIDEGLIDSVQDSIVKYLPELAERDPAFESITIEHLLRMSSGIKYREFPFLNGDDAKTYYWPDLRALTLKKTRIAGSPGDRFHYNNYHPLLLGLILERVTGVPVADYLSDKIWKPLGMEFDASWSLDSEETRFEKMESGINSRAIDFAKFGRLFLNEGDWNGRRVVPADWVRTSTDPEFGPDPTSSLYRKYYGNDYSPMHDARGYYGYFWWGRLREDGGYDFSAIGNHGQFIYVSPGHNVIIIRNGREYGVDALDWLQMFEKTAVALNAPP